MADVTRRMLELLAQLQTGRRFSGHELAARLEISPRTLRRDVERLREYGYPVSTQPGPSGFYRLAAGQTLPPLVLDDDEAVATLVGLTLLGATTSREPVDGNGFAPAADRAFGKLDQFLPHRLRPAVAALRDTVEAAPQNAPTVRPEALAVLGTAATRHEYVTFTYTSRDGRTSHRRVEPYRAVHLHLRWYLLAWDVQQADWRTFRLDRIDEISLTASHFAPRPLPARTGTEYLREGLTAAHHRAVVTIDTSAAAVADVLKFQDCEIESLGPDRCRLSTRVDSFEWLVLQVGLIGADFVIEEPAEFRDRAIELADRLRRASGL
ncbi:helix-turn-helix transcriptional regulator [Nocardia goodfellowii]|uniref:DNA-binding transcriptional regulator YafY n=1 Tax=Nocardia goodfellowii TaxID=882446 RepID=A0ABS4QLK7_9NOCA|nr:YafY family protein [Nocardia goodfellowii]MBP2192577.1 putative DNA-binding transcriptional regulator YafY [Nocardia goodfellowii]